MRPNEEWCSTVELDVFGSGLAIAVYLILTAI